MTPADLMRRLRPWGWALAALALVAALAAAGQVLGFRWDPFDLAGRRLKAAERQAADARADAAARRLEVEGVSDQARRLDDLHQQTMAAARATARAAAEARNAHDASIPLDAGRAARLRAHDRELCRLAPDLCPAAAPGPAGRDDAVLSAGPLAGRADPG